MSAKLNIHQRDFLERLRDRRSLRLADRVEDRARQSVRKAGYAEVVIGPRRWVITAAGLAALESEPPSGAPS